MIKFPFIYKNGDLKVVFNWNKQVIPCKKVKIILGKKEKTLTREEFSCLMAIFADDNQMEDILQTTKEDFVSIERMLKIKTNKDMKAGEFLIFPYHYWIPKKDYDKLKSDGEMVKIVEEDKQDLLKKISENEMAKEMKELWSKGKLSTKVEDLT
jgi:hypothetical protein